MESIKPQVSPKHHQPVGSHLNVSKETRFPKSKSNSAECWGLVSEFAHLLSEAVTGADQAGLYSKAADLIGRQFDLGRCAVLLFCDEGTSIRVISEYNASGGDTRLRDAYPLGLRSEFAKLLKNGRPVPFKDIMESGASALKEFIGADSGVIVFPLISNGNLLGCLTMQRAQTGEQFSDEEMEVSESLCEQVAALVEVCSQTKLRDNQARFFKDSSSACLVVDQNLTILSANESAAKVLTGAKVSIDGVNLSDLLAPKALVAEAIKSSIQLGTAQQSQDLNLSAAKSDSKGVTLIAYPLVSDTVSGANQNLAAVLVCSLKSTSANAESQSKPLYEEASNQATLSRQLTWERWMRQIVCRVHSSLDRDSIMQSVVDSLGRALGVSRCMVVRTESVTAPIVTHEFAEPDVSPLGLGRTGQFPARTAGHFKTRVKGVSDIVAERPNLQISDDELEWFLDNGFSSVAGAPISHHGHTYGVVVAISCGATRKWMPNELDMLEVAAAEAAIALENSQAFMQVKDQLFNMNLLGNLTQQLTNTLEMASRSNRSDPLEDKGRSDAGGPPLSFRELEVLKLIASGLANREIAQRLFLTESTVELHASRIRKKLKLKSRTALVKYACDNDLV